MEKVRKHEWLIIISSVFLVWILDYITKQWALTSITSLEFYGPFGFVLHRNPGAMLGMFSDLPPLLRIVSLSTGGAFLIFTYASIQYLLPMRGIPLRLGMSFLLGGILGNVTDRIIWGAVVDFLLIGNKEFASPAFNVADAIQWVGYAMVVYSLIKDGQKLWPTENSRKRVWVLPKFQLRFIAVLLAIGLGFAIISGVFSYTYLRIMIDDLTVGSSRYVENKFLTPFIFTYTIISSGFALLLFMIGRILSHRTAGPIYAFELFLKDLSEGKDRKLKLRSGDELKQLEIVAERIRKNIKPHIDAFHKQKQQEQVIDPENITDLEIDRQSEHDEHEIEEQLEKAKIKNSN
ncbi:MAG: signal peptidase II [Bdellovibrionales bacterium]|nr:signal peptidase II [Bdellovibrionales bacterium]